MDNWNGLDFLIFLILVLNTLRGMSRGGGKELIALMCLSAALIFAIKFTVPMANFISRSPTIVSVLESNVIANFFNAIGADPLTRGFLYEVAYSVSLLICFVGVFAATEATLNYSGMTESLSMSQALVSRKLGSAIGFTRGYIISLIVLSILTLHLYKGNRHDVGSELVTGSLFARLFASQTQKLDEMIASQRPENYHELYKDKPINEHDIINQLQKTDEQQQQLQQQQEQQQPLSQSELRSPTFSIPYR